MRLIDADALLDSDVYYDRMECLVLRYEIEKAPTIDAVPVVRCRDCMFRSGLTGVAPFMYHYCQRGVGLSGEVKDDDYCPYGDKKEEQK